MKDCIPNASRYFLSLMHQEIISHTLACSKYNLIITISQDSNVKIWQWNMENSGPPIKIARSFHLSPNHVGQVVSLSSSQEQSSFCICTEDGSFFFYDLPICDLAASFSTSFPVQKAILFSCRGRHYLGIAEKSSSSLWILNPQDGSVVFHLDKLHKAPILALDWNYQGEFGISIDRNGMIEYWNLENGQVPKGLSFTLKSQTDLYFLAKKKIFAFSCAISSDGTFLGCLCSDLSFCLWEIQTGKLVKQHSEFDNFTDEEAQLASKIKISESEIPLDSQLNQNIIFIDDFALFASFSGICLFSLKSFSISSIIGYNEKIRFLCLALLEPNEQNKKIISLERATSENPVFFPSTAKKTCLILFATGWKKSRFFLFSRGEPPESNQSCRDVKNEPNSKPVQCMQNLEKDSSIPKKATIHTEFGEIRIEFLFQNAPKTVENFCKLSQIGLFNEFFWNRIVKNCFIQIGIHLKEEESLSLCHFKDEIQESLKFDKPFLLAMANTLSVSNTNELQFFITVSPAPWLDGKHTIFGQVIGGFETVRKISLLRTDKKDRPFEKCKIREISIYYE